MSKSADDRISPVRALQAASHHIVFRLELESAAGIVENFAGSQLADQYRIVNQHDFSFLDPHTQGVPDLRASGNINIVVMRLGAEIKAVNRPAGSFQHPEHRMANAAAVAPDLASAQIMFTKLDDETANRSVSIAFAPGDQLQELVPRTYCQHVLVSARGEIAEGRILVLGDSGVWRVIDCRHHALERK